MGMFTTDEEDARALHAWLRAKLGESKKGTMLMVPIDQLDATDAVLGLVSKLFAAEGRQGFVRGGCYHCGPA